MAIADDFSVATSGDIRYTGSGSNYTVLELHRFLGDLADDAQAAGDDLVDITTDTPSDRSTDQIITLNSPFNIDDTAARHLYDGSITQDGGDTLYSGLRVLGTVESGTEIVIVQDDKVLPAYWGTGINPDAANAVIQRNLVKTRTGGADIDGKRILVLARELGDQYKEFSVTMGLANSVAAISTADDLNNNNTRATLEGYTTIGNTEGFQLIDIDGDGTAEEYYAQFDIGSQTVNDTYEWSKWQSARALIADNGTDTGTAYTVDNATITGQGQEFSARGQAEKLVEMRFRLRIGAGTPTGTMTAELYDSDDAATAAPTGAVLATSEPVLTSLLTASYQEVIFRFNDNVTLTASQEYFAVIRHADGAAGDYVEVEGAASGSDDGNRAEDSGGWTGQTNDLWFTVKSTPVWHGRPGEMHRGITHEIVYDTEAGGPFTEDEILFWGTAITYDNLQNGTFTVGNYVQFQPQGGGAVKNGGKILADNGTTQMVVALEDSSGSILLDNDIITEIETGTATTADINVTITYDNRAGGEGVLLALDDNGADGDLYIQLISGAAPVDNLPIEGRSSGATCQVNATVTSRTISPEFIGQSTGSNIIGAYGIAFEPLDVGASDIFFDLSNTQRIPPNNVTFTVTGLVSGEDRVLVGPRTAGALDRAQFTTDTALTAANETIVSIATVAVPTDTPDSGEGAENTRLRVERDSGVWKRQPYASYDAATPGNFTMSLPDSGAGGIQINITASTGTYTRLSGSFLDDGFEEDCRFTGSGFTNGGNNSTKTVATVASDGLSFTVTDNSGLVDETGGGDERVLADGWDFSTDNAASGNDVFVAYIDTLADATSEAYTAVYNSDRDLLVRVRDGGATPIKTFEGNGTFGSTSSSLAAIRTSDA